MLLLVAPASAQSQPQPDRPAVTAAATSDRVRFSAPNRVARLRLEVLSASGEVLSEVGTRGSVLDWPLLDAQGVRLLDGTYLCVLTVKDLSGRITQRLTLIDVVGDTVAARAATSADLTAKQAEAVGPVEAEAASVVEGAATAAAETPAATLLAHDGTDGQIVTTSGDLSFRGGDFFTGRDKELMRLSSDGALEVAGSILARGGIRFADGTVLSTARGLSSGKGAKGAGAGASAAPGGDSVTPAATAGRLAKFADPSGTNLTDSIVTEAGGSLGVGTTSPANPLDVVRGAAGQMGKGFYEAGSFEFDGDVKFGVYSSAPSAPSAAVTFGSTQLKVGSLFPGFELQYIYASRMRFNYIERDATGRVVAAAADLLALNGDGSVTLNPVGIGVGVSPRLGVGTSSPQSPLHVAGDVRLTGAGSGVIFADGTKQTTAAAGGGGGGGVSGAGAANTVPLWTGTSSLGNSAITQSGGNIGIGTASPDTKLDIHGSVTTDNGVALKLFNSANNFNRWFLGTGGAVVAADAFSIGDTSNYKMTILSSGNVGVGTTTPQSKLDVRGNVRLGDNGQYFATSGGENLRIVRGVIGSDGLILRGSGFTVTTAINDMTADYTINFSTVFSGTPAVTATLAADSANDISVRGADSSAITIRIRARGPVAPGLPFHFIAIGPR